MARPGKNGGVHLSIDELIELTEGMRVCKSDMISRLGVPLDNHIDQILYNISQNHGISYWGYNKPFENSANSNHFHWDSRGRDVEHQRIGASFYPNLRDLDKEEKMAADIAAGKKVEPEQKSRPVIAMLIHGRPGVLTEKLDVMEMLPERLNHLLQDSLFKVKDQKDGQTRNLRADDLKVLTRKTRTGENWQGLYLDHNVEYDKDSIEFIKANYSKDTLRERIATYQDRFTNNLSRTRTSSNQFQKELAQGLDAALVQQSLYEQANPRDQQNNRFSERNSNYMYRATEDTVSYGIGNIRNIWADLYRRGHFIMASELNENEPLGKYFVDAIEKGYNNDSPADKKDAKQALNNLKKNMGDFLIYENIDEDDNVHKVVQRIGSFKDPSRVTLEEQGEKRFLVGGGGFDAHYIEVIGRVNPNADVKPPQNIFILEGIKTAVDFAAALDIKEQAEDYNSTVVLSAGSAPNVIKLARAMAVKHEDALIAVVADNDILSKKRNATTNPGVEHSIKAVNAVVEARREIGVHPNTTYIIPPAIQNRNTDIADIREHYMKQAFARIGEALVIKNEQGGGVGVKTNEKMQENARAYAGKVFTDGFGNFVATMVNNALIGAKERGEIIYTPHFEKAKLEPVKNASIYKPLPQTFGKPRSQANPENAAIKAAVHAQSQEMYKNAPQELKDVNPNMWSHLGFKQQYNEKGELTSFSPTHSSERIAASTLLMREALDKNHPFNGVVRDLLTNNYLNADKVNYIDFKKSSYGAMALKFNMLSNIYEKNTDNPKMQGLALKIATLDAISSMAPDPEVAGKALDELIKTSDPKNQNRQVNTSTALITLAQLVSSDIAENSLYKQDKKTSVSRSIKELNTYKNTIGQLMEAVDAIPDEKLNPALKNGETKKQLLDSLDFSQKYASVTLQNSIASNTPTSTDPDAKIQTAAYKKAVPKFVDMVQSKLFAGAMNGPAEAFFEKLEKLHPAAKDSIEDLRDYSDETGLSFADESASTNLYKKTSTQFYPPDLGDKDIGYLKSMNAQLEKEEIMSRDVRALAKLESDKSDNQLQAQQEQVKPTETKPAPKPEVVDEIGPSGP